MYYPQPPFDFTNGSPDFDSEINRNTDQARGLTGIVIAQPAPNALLWKPQLNYSALSTVGGTFYNPIGLIGVAGAAFATADSADYAFTSGSYTQLAWTYVLALPGAGEYPSIAERANYVSESDNQGWTLTITASNDPTPNQIRSQTFSNNNANFYALSTGVTAVANMLYMVAHTSNGTTRRIYLNGIERANSSSNPNPASASAALNVGQDLTTARIKTLRVLFYDRALSAHEIWQHYQQGTRDELFYPIGQRVITASRALSQFPPINKLRPAIFKPGLAR